MKRQEIIDGIVQNLAGRKKKFRPDLEKVGECLKTDSFWKYLAGFWVSLMSEGFRDGISQFKIQIGLGIEGLVYDRHTIRNLIELAECRTELEDKWLTEKDQFDNTGLSWLALQVANNYKSFYNSCAKKLGIEERDLSSKPLAEWDIAQIGYADAIEVYYQMEFEKKFHTPSETEMQKTKVHEALAEILQSFNKGWV